MRYFIGNWKMFGVPKSINILTKLIFTQKTKTVKNTELLLHHRILRLKLMPKRIFILVLKTAIKKISFHPIQQQLAHI